MRNYLEYKAEINALLADPEKLMKKRPFTRGRSFRKYPNETVYTGGEVRAEIPDDKLYVVSQSTFLAELDPNSHDVLFDDNIPSISVKINKDQYQELEFKKTAIPFQRMILNKHVLHLCANPTMISLNTQDPSETQLEDFATVKKYWLERNMDGIRTRFVTDQKSCGDSALLFYHDRHGQIKARILSYSDGYVLCSHNDRNGDRLLESILFMDNEVKCIDSYDDTYIYRHRLDGEGKWRMLEPIRHGFSEIPVVSRRGDVPWGPVQSLCEVFEIIYNIFMVIQKRHGWGILFIKGKVKNEAMKLAGAIILNDDSLSGNSSAQYLIPPTPEGMIDTMKELFEKIQMGSGTTFILPKDISLGGDISGVAVQIAQSLDNESALRASIDWQNAISKMLRLFTEGLAMELVDSGSDPTAVTRFADLDMTARLKPWMPKSDTDYNSMLIQLAGSGLISQKTGIEKNTESLPDEFLRVMSQHEEAIREQLELQKQENALQDAQASAESQSTSSQPEINSG